MLEDLTPLFPQEPLEPGAIHVIDRLPHWLLNRELHRVLLELGFTWTGGIDLGFVDVVDRQNGIIATLSIGTIRNYDQPKHDAGALFDVVADHMRHIRYMSRSYKFVLANIIHGPKNAWFRFHFVKPSDRFPTYMGA